VSFVSALFGLNSVLSGINQTHSPYFLFLFARYNFANSFIFNFLSLFFLFFEGMDLLNTALSFALWTNLIISLIVELSPFNLLIWMTTWSQLLSLYCIEIVTYLPYFSMWCDSFSSVFLKEVLKIALHFCCMIIFVFVLSVSNLSLFLTCVFSSC